MSSSPSSVSRRRTLPGDKVVVVVADDAGGGSGEAMDVEVGDVESRGSSTVTASERADEVKVGVTACRADDSSGVAASSMTSGSLVSSGISGGKSDGLAGNAGRSSRAVRGEVGGEGCAVFDRHRFFRNCGIEHLPGVDV